MNPGVQGFPENARILIVDDQEANIRLLESILRRASASAVLRSTTDPREVMSLYPQFDPDLILLDLLMPYIDGYVVMEQLKPLTPAGSYLPILVITADITPEAKQRALAGGGEGFPHETLRSHRSRPPHQEFAGDPLSSCRARESEQDLRGESARTHAGT